MAAGNENNAWINGGKLMTAGFHWNVSQAGMFSALCLHNVLLYTGEKWQNQDMKERQLSETLQCPLGLCTNRGPGTYSGDTPKETHKIDFSRS